MKASEISRLLQRRFEGEPGFSVERRAQGQCYFCKGRLGREVEVPRLFAVAADGGMLLRLPRQEREAVVQRGICRPNSVLPKWVLYPPRVGDEAASGGGGERTKPEHDKKVFGDPSQWVWMPIEDMEAFERRRPHILEALEFYRFALETEGGAEEEMEEA